MSGNRDTLRTIIEESDHAVTMPDGSRLSARLWRPQDAEADPVPLILEFLPYRKRDGILILPRAATPAPAWTCAVPATAKA